MKIPQFAQKFIVKLILGKVGPETQKAITGIASAVVALLAIHLPGAEQYLSLEVLTGLLWVVIDIGTTRLAAGPLKKYALELQAFLNENGAILDEDKYIGPVTVDAVKRKIKVAQKPRYSKA